MKIPAPIKAVLEWIVESWVKAAALAGGVAFITLLLNSRVRAWVSETAPVARWLVLPLLLLIVCAYLAGRLRWTRSKWSHGRDRSLKVTDEHLQLFYMVHRPLDYWVKREQDSFDLSVLVDGPFDAAAGCAGPVASKIAQQYEYEIPSRCPYCGREIAIQALAPRSAYGNVEPFKVDDMKMIILIEIQRAFRRGERIRKSFALLEIPYAALFQARGLSPSPTSVHG